MGANVIYKCSKCGKKYWAQEGFGMLFPLVYEETLQKAKDGELGHQMQELALNTKNVAIDAELKVYYCGKCNHWESDTCYSLYAPNFDKPVPEVVPSIWKEIGVKCEERLFDYDAAEYVTEWELKNYYHLIRRYIHKCPKCKSRMHIATKKELDNLRCPDCGGEKDKEFVGFMNWD